MSETFGELARPLLAQARRSQDEHAVRGTTRAQFGDDEAGLNRFPQPHIVRQQQTHAGAAHERERGLELIRHQLDAGTVRGAERGRPVLGRNEAAESAPPAPAAHDAEARRSLDAAERVEWGQQSALDAGDRSGEPGQRDDLAGIVGAHVHDAPARAPDDDEVAGADLMSVVGGRRNLHRVSGARSQNLRRACGALPEIEGLRQASERDLVSGQR